MTKKSRLMSTFVLAYALCASAAGAQAAPGDSTASLLEARRGFVTHIVKAGDADTAPETPPAGVFDLIRYSSPAGKLAAYVTPNPNDGARHPAIVWVTGGDSNSIGDSWKARPRNNDQSAAAYRKAGVVTMIVSLRGGNNNPGRREGFYGEVDDVLAAADYLATLPYVDPQQIYMGGHSTGGTLAMLVAESSSRFRAVFAFGPVADVRLYGGAFVYHDTNIAKENELRAPGRWLAGVRSPLFVLEGAARGNLQDLKAMKAANSNPMIRFLPVPNKDHFSILAPANELIAERLTTKPALAASELLSDTDAGTISGR